MKEEKMKKRGRQGFTLVELIVVLVILAILAAILVPQLLGWIDEAKDRQYMLEAKNVRMATQMALDEWYAKGEEIGTQDSTTGSVVVDALLPAVMDKIEELSGSNVSAISMVMKGSEGQALYTPIAMDITFVADGGTMITAKWENGQMTIVDASEVSGGAGSGGNDGGGDSGPVIPQVGG